jgi:hypothetical protein
VHLPSDPTVVGPLCLDLMDGICSSPLCFLRSLDVDLTVQDPLHNRSKGCCSPPPELLTSSTLEEFCQCSKVSAFELSSANPGYSGSRLCF